MKDYNLVYLEEKLGSFDKKYKYPTKSISGFNLIYVETETKEELKHTLKVIKEEETPGYIWGYVKESKSTYVTRAFGENKIFNYNPDVFKNKTEYVKGKLNVLKNLSEETINDLFDQKAVLNNFYTKLWYLRKDFGIEIRDKNGISDNNALMAAQHIIDRIIFTYFICEKDLVTLNEQKVISSKTLFNSISKMPDPWKCLKNLFFEQFAKKESKPLMMGKNARIITPYLNGGLFRPKTIEGISEIDLIIECDKEQWQKLFEPLNKYTWIIEDEITDHEGDYEGNLTPEIIGHIYEKFVISLETLDEIKLEELKISKKGDLIKGNKTIGAYYTPEYVTDYISRNTITPNIFDKLGIKEKIDFKEFINNSNAEILNKTLEILDEITICDPACGSGAFLIKAGEILLEYKTEIYKRLEKPIDRYKFKKRIIIKNLYGVDIQEGAVEICKLRLWLWLISSSKDKKVEPLPNIEYNFMVGNSLLGWTNEKLTQSVLIHVDKTVLTILDALELHYKSGQIKEIKEKLQKTDMQSYADAVSLLKNLYSCSTADEAERLKKIIETVQNAIYKEINRIFYDHIKLKQKKILEEEYEKFKPFHWILEFSEVFQSPKLGFDIIIGNPPYGNLLKKEEKKILSFYKTIKNSEIAANFVERSISLLNDDSSFGQIIANSIAINKSTSTCRGLIKKNFEETSMALFNTRPAKIFDDADVRVMIMISHKIKKSYSGIYTTDAIKLTKETKKDFKNLLNFECTAGLELGKEKICDGTDVALPKVGYAEIKEVLNILKQESDIIFSDVIKNNGEYSLDLRKSARYWLIALENFPYHNTKIKKLSFSSEVERDFAVIVINSSLFYLFWSTYGNLRDFSDSLFGKFPCPKTEELQEHAEEITFIKNQLISCLMKNYDITAGQAGVGEFNYAKCKNLMDEADNLISKFYGLDKRLVDFIINYDSHIRPNQQNI